MQSAVRMAQVSAQTLAQTLVLAALSAPALAALSPADIEAAQRQADFLQRQQQEQFE